LEYKIYQFNNNLTDYSFPIRATQEIIRAIQQMIRTIAQFGITINSNVCPHIQVLNTLMRKSYA